MNNLFNKRAQIAETTTWVVATLIIVVILTFSIFVSSWLGHQKNFPYSNRVDLFADKSLTSYLLTKDSSGNSIYASIQNNADFNSFNGNLAQEIFTSLYSSYYNHLLFLGYTTIGNCPLAHPFSIVGCFYKNNYFSNSPNAGSPADDTPAVLLVNLLDNKYTDLTLWH